MEHDETVVYVGWIATYRKGIEWHWVRSETDTTTTCGRSTRAGYFVTRAAIDDIDAKPCPRCAALDKEVG